MEKLTTMTVLRKIDVFYFRYFPLALTAVSLSVIPSKLAMMQTDGLLAFGGAFVTSLFAMTSLMYARARATADADEMLIRANVADECLKLSLLAVMAFIVTGFTFLALSEDYGPRIGHVLDSNGEGAETGPAIASFLCTTFFAVPIVAKINRVIEMIIDNMGLSHKKTLIVSSNPKESKTDG